MISLVLAFAAGLQAYAQPAAGHRPFSEADYPAYFNHGTFLMESPTYSSRGVSHHGPRDGKLMISYVEVMPKWHRSSPYPFVKVEGLYPLRIGKFDKKLGANVFTITDREFEGAFGTIWLSRNPSTSVSPKDYNAGPMRKYNMMVAVAEGMSAKAADADYRNSVVGRWTLRCAFLKSGAYEVECVETHLGSGFTIIRRYTKQTLVG